MKFRVIYEEIRYHHYDVEAKDGEEAEEKCNTVYYQGEDKQGVKFLASKDGDNNLISCKEVKEDEC